jgi:hypothetical protein
MSYMLLILLVILYLFDYIDVFVAGRSEWIRRTAG